MEATSGLKIVGGARNVCDETNHFNGASPCRWLVSLTPAGRSSNQQFSAEIRFYRTFQYCCFGENASYRNPTLAYAFIPPSKNTLIDERPRQWWADCSSPPRRSPQSCISTQNV